MRDGFDEPRPSVEGGADTVPPVIELLNRDFFDAAVQVPGRIGRPDRRGPAVWAGQGLRQRFGHAFGRRFSGVDTRMAGTGVAQTEAVRFALCVLHLAIRAGNFQFPENAAHDDQRNHLGPPRAEHGAVPCAALRRCMTTSGISRYRRTTTSISTPCAFPTTPRPRRRVRANCSKAVNGFEVGYNRKISGRFRRLHRQHAERVAHPTQKPLEIVERMVLASCPPGWPRARSVHGGAARRPWLAHATDAHSSAMRSMKRTARSRAKRVSATPGAAGMSTGASAPPQGGFPSERGTAPRGSHGGRDRNLKGRTPPRARPPESTFPEKISCPVSKVLLRR